MRQDRNSRKTVGTVGLRDEILGSSPRMTEETNLEDEVEDMSDVDNEANPEDNT